MMALVASNGTASLRQRPIPRAAWGEVVVRVTAASMCAADPAGVKGSFNVVPETDATAGLGSRGVVLGHESVGVVHELGAGVEGFVLGDRVVTASTASCGRCENCQRGVTGHCRNTEWAGFSFGQSRDGSLAEYFVVNDAQFNLTHVPDAVTDADALFVSDSFATGSAAVEGGRLPFGGTVLVIGQGPIGLGATAAARVAGAGLVITVKSRPGGSAVSRAMGADLALNHTEHDVRQEVLRLTQGKGVDLVIEASGSPAAFELAVELSRLGGQISGIASYTSGGFDQLSIPLKDWSWGVGDKSIVTSFQPAGSERTGRLLRLLERGRVSSAPMFTHEYDFTDALQALDDVRQAIPGLIKPLIRFQY